MTTSKQAAQFTFEAVGDIFRVIKDNFWLWICIAAVLVGVIVLAADYGKRTTREVVVQDKERVCKNDGGDRKCEYLVFTDHGTYKVTDSVLLLRYNSSDLYGRIKPCHLYEVESYGWRLGFISEYPNVVSMKDLGRVDGCEN